MKITQPFLLVVIFATICYCEEQTARKLFTNSCSCGHVYGNDCAHFASNALIKAGETIEGWEGMAKCPHGRPIRAKELRTWASRNYGVQYKERDLERGLFWRHGNHRMECIVYQGRGSYRRGHIALADVTEDGVRVAGTGWYPKWSQQEYYCKKVALPPKHTSFSWNFVPSGLFDDFLG